MAAPTFVAASAKATGTSGTITMAWPAGVQAGDTIIWIIQTANEANFQSTNIGWNYIGAFANKGQGPAATAGSCVLQAWWRRYAIGEAAPTMNMGSTNHFIGQILAFRGGVVIGTPYSDYAEAYMATAQAAVSWGFNTAQWVNGGSVSASSGDFSSTVNDSLIVFIGAHAIDSNSAQTTIAPLGPLCDSYGALTGADVSTNTGVGGGLVSGAGPKAVAGAVSAVSPNHIRIGIASSKNSTLILALKPYTPPPNPYFVAAGASGSTAPGLPAGIAANDILLLFCQSSNEAITAPSGYTEIDTQTRMATGTAAAAGSLRLAVFWKRAGSSESAPTITNPGNHIISQILAFRGCETVGNPYNTVGTGFYGSPTTSHGWNTYLGPNQWIDGVAQTSGTNAFSTLLPNQTLVAAIAHAVDSLTAQCTFAVPGSGYSSTLESGYGELTGADVSTTTGTGGGFGVAAGYAPTAGNVIGSWTLGITLAATSKAAVFMLGLIPPQVQLPKLIAAKGDFAATGQAVGLLWGQRAIALPPGSYAMTGQAVALPRGKSFPLDRGAYIFQSPVAGGLNDGDPVSSWPDSSGNANVATQTGSNRPIFKTNILNGQPVVRFDAASAQSLNITGIVTTGGETIFVVMKGTAGGNMPSLGVAGAGAYPSPEDNNFGPYHYNSNTVYFSPNGQMFSSATVDKSVFRVFTGISATNAYVYTMLRLDGTDQTIGGISSNTATALNVIGRRNLDLATGDIAEIIAYGVQLSATDISNIEKYLGDKYGLTVAGGTAVDPGTVSGLSAWWKADSLLGIGGGGVNLRRTRMAPLAFGPYALTGQATNYLRGRRIPTVQGAYSLSGQPVNLPRGKAMLIVKGQFQALGLDVLFKRAYKNALAQGAFSLAGQAANTLFGRRLIVDSGGAGALASDNFNRANGGLGTNWTTESGLSAIVSNACQGSTGGAHNVATYNASGPLPADQYAQCRVTILGNYVGPVLRSNGAGTFYTCFYRTPSDENFRIYYVSGGSYTLIGGGTAFIPATAGDDVYFEAVGSTLTMKVNGAVVATATNSSITGAGYAGIDIFDVGGAVDDFQAGAVGAGAGPTFALTGQPANLNRGQLMALAFGAFTFAGQAGNLLRGIKMPLAQAAYGLTGFAVGLTKAITARTMTVLAGAFTFAGQAANLLRGRRGGPVTGIFSFAGQPASLLQAHRGGPVAGVFSFAGQPASLRAARQIPVVSGFFTLAGQPVTLTRITVGHFVVTADRGIFTLTGQPINLPRARRIVQEPGAYTYTGIAVQAHAGKGLALARGILDVTGQPIEARGIGLSQRAPEPLTSQDRQGA